eukprot:1160176-Pelagomonas_calceolata.AAC.6
MELKVSCSSRFMKAAFNPCTDSYSVRYAAQGVRFHSPLLKLVLLIFCPLRAVPVSGDNRAHHSQASGIHPLSNAPPPSAPTSRQLKTQ